MSNVAEEPQVVHELFFSSEGGTEEELQLSDGEKQKVVWKDVLRTGKFAMTPGPAGAVRKPFTVVAEGESDPQRNIISMSDIKEAHDERAFEHVTIPTRHADELLDNTGFVPQPNGLRIVKRGDTHVMQAALGFTEPDIAGKVRRGTIPNVSCGIFFDFVRKADAKKFRVAMKHVALTHTPFINKLTPFKAVLATDEEVGDNVEVQTFQFADEVNGTAANAGGSSNTTANSGDAEIVWNENEGTNWIREEINTALQPPQQPDDGRPYQPQPYYYVRDISVNDQALVEESFKGDRKTFIIPFERKDDGVSVAPQTRWTEAREAFIAASDDNFADMTSGSVREKLGIRLSDMAVDTQYNVGEITLDHRVKITSGDKSWVAGFAVFSDGTVHIDAPAQWTALSDGPTKSTTTEQESQRPTPASRRAALLSDTDTTGSASTGSVSAARQRRRQLVKS